MNGVLKELLAAVLTNTKAADVEGWLFYVF